MHRNNHKHILKITIMNKLAAFTLTMVKLSVLAFILDIIFVLSSGGTAGTTTPILLAVSIIVLLPLYIIFRFSGAITSLFKKE